MADGDQSGQQQAGGGQQQQQQAAPWYEGKADAETVGTWQNKAWDYKDPATVALEATKAYREAQKFIGAPPDRIIRLPEKADDQAGWNSVWSRLGAPADAKDYDLTAVKHANGEAPAAALLDTIRSTAAALHLPKDRAGDLASAIVKHLDAGRAEETAARAAKIAEQKANLDKSWGANKELNRLTAMQGAQRLGVDPETVASLENVVGYDKVMEMFRKIGSVTREDTFVEGGAQGGNPATRESAVARLDELQKDTAWSKRFLSGDTAAVREFQSLTQLIAA